jgi:hypothetical protein
MKDFVLPLAFTVLIVVGVGGMIRAVNVWREGGISIQGDRK